MTRALARHVIIVTMLTILIITHHHHHYHPKKAYPAFFKISQQPKLPHVNVDNLRDDLYQVRTCIHTVSLSLSLSHTHTHKRGRASGCLFWCLVTPFLFPFIAG
jgi:hypothetical protein